MTPATPDPYAGSAGKRRVTTAVAAVLGVVAAILGALVATGILRLGGAAPEPVARKEGAAPAAITRKEAAAPPPMAAIPAERKIMPDDVRAWMAWLKEIEREKQSLTARQAGEMTVFKATLSTGGLGSAADVDNMASPDGTFNFPLDKLRSQVTGWKQAWYDLDAKFSSRPPPASCVPARDAFSGGLGEIGGQMADVARTFESLNADAGDARDAGTEAMARARGVETDHRTVVDAGFRKTNEEVGKVYAAYDERPDFTIDEGGKVGGLFSGGL